MKTKTFEIRDRGTFIPAIATRIAPEDWNDDANEKDRYLMRRAGYRSPLVLLGRIDGGIVPHYDIHEWNDRTYHVAHGFIEKSWDALESGAVVDVQFILGETDAPKISEQDEVFV